MAGKEWDAGSNSREFSEEEGNYSGKKRESDWQTINRRKSARASSHKSKKNDAASSGGTENEGREEEEQGQKGWIS